MISHKELTEKLTYDPDSGIFTWNVETRRVPAGSIAGGSLEVVSRNNRYVKIGVGGRRYLAHRLAWYYMTGEWPEFCIDHIDRNTVNNRWSNLRAATHHQNRLNQKVRSDSSTGIKNVHPLKSGYVVVIKSKSGIYRKEFEDLESAVEHSIIMRKKLHGDFAT